MKIFSSSIDNFLKSLVVLSLLLTGYVTSTKSRPSAVNHYGDMLTPPSAPISNGNDDDDGFGFFDRFHFGSIFGKQQPNQPGDGGGEEIPPEYEQGSTTKSLGYWKIHSQNAGVAAMHIQLLPNGKAIMYDSTSNGLSEITLNPPSCAPRVGGRPTDPQQDCTAHAIEYDVETAQIRTLKLETSPWCSSGGLNKNGDLVSTGGDKAGFQSVRLLKHCKNCNFQENPRALYSNRWYATQVALDNGSFALVGGRNAYSYEIIPPDTLNFTPQLMELPLLEDTDDDAGRENNLYPFAARDCGRLNLNVEGGQWEKEDMPSPRVMGDMLLLPNGDVLMINGAKAGTSAWNAAKDPNLTPVLYSPNKRVGKRFKELAPTVIPRMYHSVSAVLPSGEILVAGSNTNPFYMLEKYEDDYTFPSELRVEKFYPPYMAPDQIKYRLEILRGRSENLLKYGVEFGVAINAKGNENIGKDGYIKVTMYSPPFTTHGYSQNQRLLILKLKEVTDGKITAVAPPSPTLAPPGYYLLFVVYRDVPSRGIWVHIQ
ncbi:glyoxal oxidase-related protein [Striga hermonthica]|uniref:Glyoxal oxidase-related protein n=1 Tax=Striga hermonthica TaxID=68872 RepID=A0A9N7NJL1_STRHE|nr:glyoxal oxidase-related protein [Striga hermonthica]